MKIYLVRHGETVFNALNVHQTSSSELSASGKKQAEDLAKRLENIDLDIVLSSSHLRAKQTAEIIINKIRKPLEISDLLVEKKRPSEIENKKHEDPAIAKIKEEIEEHYHDEEWHFSDEENFYDLVNRANKAIDYIESQKVENVLVVSHGLFIRVLLGVIIFGEDFNSKMGKKLIASFHTHNSGITMLEKLADKWRLLTWNDYAHLG